MAVSSRDSISPTPVNEDIANYSSTRRISTPASNYVTGTPQISATDISTINGGPSSSYVDNGSNLKTTLSDNVYVGNPTALSMDDDTSKILRDGRVDDYSDIELLMRAARHSGNLYDRSELDLQHRYFRYGVINPYEAVSTGREFLFFTKPDLSILKYPENSTALAGILSPSLTDLRDELAGIPFWKELMARYPDTIYSLQKSAKPTAIDEPFNLLLANMVNSNLEVPSLSAEMIDTPTNMYGVGYSYRGSSEASNDNYEFSLEFKDTMNFPIYMYFKTYEEYETLKHHGVIGPHPYYIQHKILHDHTAIYKFIVGEDMETILYYGMYAGVVPKSLPRDIFSSVSFDGGISFSIDFKAAFYDELNPLILSQFNRATKTAWDQAPYRVDVYNEILMQSDMRPVTTARVVAETANNAPGGFRYKLKWKGMNKI